MVDFLSFCYAAPDIGELRGCFSSAVPAISVKRVWHTLKMPFGKIRPIFCYFLSHPKEREEYNFVTSKGKGRPGLSFVEVRASINRFGGGTMENIEP